MVRRISLSSQRRRISTSWVVVIGEFGAGLSITFGLITYAGLAVALFLNFNYLVLAGPKDQGEQGQNLMMLLIGVVLIATAAGMTWGVDANLF